MDRSTFQEEVGCDGFDTESVTGIPFEGVQGNACLDACWTLEDVRQAGW